MQDRMMLQTTDYVVIAAMLVIPLGIGMFFAIKDAKRTTRDEYLLGGRRMTMLPVTLSIFVTFQSAISVLGYSTELYSYGPMFAIIYVGGSLIYIVCYFTILPLFYTLQLTSVYEYLQMRFECRAVRLVSTCVAIVQSFFYMTVALLAPGLALEAAAGTPLWLSVVIVGAVGTVYTAAGGIKSVIWTDAFQCVVLLVGLYGVMVKATHDVGGVGKVFEYVHDGGRTRLDSISPDPRARHTWWGLMFGGTAIWFCLLFNQSTMQRISSMKSLRTARQSMALNVPVNMFYGVTLVLLGFCMYAYLFHIRCDPVHTGMLKNYNQLPIFFVMHAMYDVPGMAGLFMSSLFSAALSTVSSGINAMAANTVEDILQKPLKSVSEKTATTVTKAVVLIYGMAIIAMTFLVKSAQGPITQMAFSILGLFGSAITGMFLLGCTVPWANKYGAMTGAMTSLALNLWLAIGARLYGRSPPRLDPVPSDMCFNLTRIDLNDFTSIRSNITELYYTDSGENTSKTIPIPLPSEFSPYDISYVWYGPIGLFVCYFVGFVVSMITRRKAETKPDPKLILHHLRRFWYPDEPALINEGGVDIIDFKDYNLREV